MRRISFMSLLIFLFCSHAYCQLITDSSFKKFNSSVLIHTANSITKNLFSDIVFQNSRNFTHLKYHSLFVEDNLDSTKYNTAWYRSFKVGKQIVFSQVFGATLAFSFAVVGSQIAPNIGWKGTYILYGGYIAGTMLGVHIFGNDKYEKAPFVDSLIGGLIGLPIGYLIFNSDKKQRGFTAIAPFVFPTIGAVISFNLLSKPR